MRCCASSCRKMSRDLTGRSDSQDLSERSTIFLLIKGNHVRKAHGHQILDSGGRLFDSHNNKKVAAVAHSKIEVAGSPTGSCSQDRTPSGKCRSITSTLSSWPTRKAVTRALATPLDPGVFSAPSRARRLRRRRRSLAHPARSRPSAYS